LPTPEQIDVAESFARLAEIDLATTEWPDRTSRKALAEAAGVDSKVILFGAHARGEERPGSDVDFLVIEPEIENRFKEWDRLRRAVDDILLPVDIIVLDQRLAERRAKIPGRLPCAPRWPSLRPFLSKHLDMTHPWAQFGIGSSSHANCRTKFRAAAGRARF
jgi:uncharacterized protein